MSIKFVPPKKMTEEEYNREFNFGVRLLRTRFEIKLIIITQSYLMSHKIHKGTDYVVKFVSNAIKRFGGLLLKLPENTAEYTEQKRKNQLSLLDAGLPQQTVDAILVQPDLITYPFSANEDPMSLDEYKLTQKLDSFIIQYFDSLTLDIPEIYENDLAGSPLNVARLLAIRKGTTRESIMSEILTMDPIDPNDPSNF